MKYKISIFILFLSLSCTDYKRINIELGQAILTNKNYIEVNSQSINKINFSWYSKVSNDHSEDRDALVVSYNYKTNVIFMTRAAYLSRNISPVEGYLYYMSYDLGCHGTQCNGVFIFYISNSTFSNVNNYYEINSYQGKTIIFEDSYESTYCRNYKYNLLYSISNNIIYHDTNTEYFYYKDTVYEYYNEILNIYKIKSEIEMDQLCKLIFALRYYNTFNKENQKNDLINVATSTIKKTKDTILQNELKKYIGNTAAEQAGGAEK